MKQVFIKLKCSKFYLGVNYGDGSRPLDQQISSRFNWEFYYLQSSWYFVETSGPKGPSLNKKITLNHLLRKTLILKLRK
jgi:hypothetical protein